MPCIIYHADCLDGFGAAFAAWRHFGDAAEYLPMHHGQLCEMGKIADQDLFILDFSFAPEVLKELAATAKSVTQIDHHLSARKAWNGLLQAGADGKQSYQHPELPLRVIFDLDKSGARLAWEHFHPTTALPLALAHIEDQDMWRFALPGTRAFCRALRQQPFEFSNWDDILQATADHNSARYRSLLEQGVAIESFFGNEIERLANSALRMPARLRGEAIDALQAVRHEQESLSNGEQSWLAISGTAINANALFASELGNRLAEQSGSFGLIWQLAGDGEAKVSLRSKGDFDVAAIAQRYGGGGHRNAAGFRLPAGQFFAEILALGGQE
ncbi:DHH family phosphoesterase [Quatrionicoccus australiensis]|uniref:DHH family phosphoesterase n=1 Tax=Quatrionicoccus australiensis TaxID=138118 RepID=UPI001CFB2CDB|nr:DHHA1 domain-containing protein [Quatrionicoccus australiensis]